MQKQQNTNKQPKSTTNNPKQTTTHTTKETEKVEINENSSTEFKLERYKYILLQIHTLNDNTHKYLNLFHILITAIISAAIGIFVISRQLQIEIETVRIAIHGLKWLLIILGIFITTSMIISIFAWFDYRKEEVEILNEIYGPSFRTLPSYKNFWRWQETYFIGFVIIVVIALWSYAEFRFIPLITNPTPIPTTSISLSPTPTTNATPPPNPTSSTIPSPSPNTTQRPTP